MLIIQAFADLANKVREVNKIRALLQDSQQTFKRGFARVEPIVEGLFEGAHLHDADVFLAGGMGTGCSAQHNERLLDGVAMSIHG